MIGHATRWGIPPLYPPLAPIYCRSIRRRVRSARLGRAERGNQLGAGLRCPGANPGHVPGSADRPCEPVSSPRRPTTDRGPRTASLRTHRCRFPRGCADSGAARGTRDSATVAAAGRCAAASRCAVPGRCVVAAVAAAGRCAVPGRCVVAALAAARRCAAAAVFGARGPFRPGCATPDGPAAAPRRGHASLLPAPAGARAATPHGTAAPESPPAAAPPVSPPNVAAAAVGRSFAGALNGARWGVDGAAWRSRRAPRGRARRASRPRPVTRSLRPYAGARSSAGPPVAGRTALASPRRRALGRAGAGAHDLATRTSSRSRSDGHRAGSAVTTRAPRPAGQP
jgi:hypothetical protein